MKERQASIDLSITVSDEPCANWTFWDHGAKVPSYFFSFHTGQEDFAGDSYGFAPYYHSQDYRQVVYLSGFNQSQEGLKRNYPRYRRHMKESEAPEQFDPLVAVNHEEGRVPAKDQRVVIISWEWDSWQKLARIQRSQS